MFSCIKRTTNIIVSRFFCFRLKTTAHPHLNRLIYSYCQLSGMARSSIALQDYDFIHLLNYSSPPFLYRNTIQKLRQ